MIGIDTTFLVQLEIRESLFHEKAKKLLNDLRNRQAILCITPQVLSEFLHIVTDGRRFEIPLSMEEAVERAEFWWQAYEVRRIFPNAYAMTLLLDWMKKYNLGRKRILDTQLAATFYANEIERVMTTNADDFKVFGCFEFICP